MPRPGFVLDVDRSTPPILFWRGEQLTSERLPVGSRVVYAPEPLAPLGNVSGAIRDALTAPVGGDPLASRLRPGMKLTIAFDDVSTSVPSMRRPDIRQRVLEAVLDLAADARVDDVELIAAIGINRRMTEDELRHAIGDRSFDSFGPKGLLWQHDAEDAENLVEVGKTDEGELVEISKRVAESDLLIFLNITENPDDGGFAPLATRLTSYRTVKAQNGTQTIAGATARIGRLIAQHVNVFQIEATLTTETFPPAASFLQRREWEWTPKDRLTYAATRGATDLAPRRTSRQLLRTLQSPNSILSLYAGDIESVHESTTAVLDGQRVTPIEGQADIVTAGVPYFGPYSVNSIVNPVLVAFMGLGHSFNLNRGRPMVREGGVMILHHPTRWEFDPVQHPSYIDFFEQVLADTTDATAIERDYEEKFATDAWYTHLYRTSSAYHGTHPLHLWYACAKALDYLGGVIIVGGERAAVKRLGFRSASTFYDALEMAQDITGTSSPTLAHMHAPPSFSVDVR